MYIACHFPTYHSPKHSGQTETGHGKCPSRSTVGYPGDMAPHQALAGVMLVLALAVAILPLLTGSAAVDPTEVLGVSLPVSFRFGFQRRPLDLSGSLQLQGFRLEVSDFSPLYSAPRPYLKPQKL